MATNYPGSLDTSTQQPSPSASTEMDDSGFEHDAVHTNHSGAIIALETKVGTGDSNAVANSVLAGTGSGTSGWTTTPTLVKLTVADAGEALRMERSGYDSYGFQHSAGSGIEFRNFTDGVTEMYFNGAGNVGIGTTSPETPLNIVTANKLGATFTGTTDGEGLRVDQSNYTADNYVSLVEASYQDDQTAPHVRIGAQFTGSGSKLVFGTSNSYGSGITNAALVIDPTGNLLPNGHIYGTASANFFVGNNFNERILFQESSNTIFFMTDNTYRARVESTGVSPYIDNTQDLGQSGRRWDDVFATNGTIQTSDQRDKTSITDLDFGLDFINDLRPVSFIWNDRSGYTGTRTHMGFVAQEVASTLGDQASDRAVWINSPAGSVHTADGTEDFLDRQGIRYEELIAPLVKAVQQLSVRVTALEAA